MNVYNLGWSPFFEAAFEEASGEYSIPARVIRQHKNRFLLHDGSTTYSGTVLGKLLYASEDVSSLPAVGDWVVMERFEDGQAVIHAVLPRRTVFYRKEAGQVTRRQVLAANIDRLFLVSGLDNDFNLRRIERYLVQASGSGAEPVIVLNKADLCSNIEEVIQSVKDVSGDVDIIVVSAKESTGIDTLETYIQAGETVAFLGSSGVGKSSIVNHLLASEAQKVAAVREDDSRGRHTTTHRELIVLPRGGIVMDTPGLRELQLWTDEEDLHEVFEDVEELAQECRFRNCLHHSEPGCAVQQALDSGELDSDRFNSYLKLKREIAFLNQRQSEKARQKARKRERNFGKLMKEIKKHNPKR